MIKNLKLLILFFLVLLPTFFVVTQVNAQTKNYSIPINKTVIVEPKVGVFKLNNEFDYRARVLDEYFKRNDSPLEGKGKNFIQACEKYGAPDDCTLLPAIGYIETRLCTLALSEQQNNCWGWGGAGENRVIFSDLETAIDEITKNLMEIPFYGTEFFEDPVSAQFFYCGAHCDKWGTHVQNARLDINELSIELGYPPLF